MRHLPEKDIPTSYRTHIVVYPGTARQSALLSAFTHTSYDLSTKDDRSKRPHFRRVAIKAAWHNTNQTVLTPRQQRRPFPQRAHFRGFQYITFTTNPRHQAKQQARGNTIFSLRHAARQEKKYKIIFLRRHSVSISYSLRSHSVHTTCRRSHSSPANMPL